jgi:Domain of unknown function (DUF4157)
MSKRDQGRVAQSSVREGSRKQATVKRDRPASQANTVAVVQRALSGAGMPSAGEILRLQATIGNRAVGQLLARRHAATRSEAKLTVGAATDPYEREADRVASEVMSSNVLTASSLSLTKSTFGKEDDTPPTAQRTTAITPLVRRVIYQNKNTDLSGSFDAGEDVEQQISANRSGGSPLPARLRLELEPKFGADFSNVRLHTGAQSDSLNRSIGAQAFTHSNHIYMAAGKYSPGTGAGRRLLAHELTHVVQQTGAQIHRLTQPATADTPFASVGGVNHFVGSDTEVIQPKLVDDSGKIVQVSDLDKNPLFIADKEKLDNALADKTVQYALSPENAMYITLQNLRDYLDGAKVPGLSNLGKGDVISGGAGVGQVEDEQQRALTLAKTLARMVKNRKKQESSERQGASQVGKLINIYSGKAPEDIGEQTEGVANAFKNTTFYYGTTGEQGKAGWKNLLSRANKAKQKRLGDKAGSYNAGDRNLAFLNKMGGTEDHQMMDMYYGGQEFEAWQMMRNPAIGAYIHKMMGYAGDYNQAESPDATFRKNYPLGGAATAKNWKGEEGDSWLNRGWSSNSKPQNNPQMKGKTPQEWLDDMSATMEISRIIREGVRKWGGKIVMEHKNVVWDNIFGTRARYGDTDKEIESFMEEFLKQKSATCKWGAGELIYTYGGKPEAITKTRVRNDFWFGGSDPDPAQKRPVITPANEHTYILNKKDWYDQLDEGRAAARRDLGGNERIKMIDYKSVMAKAKKHNNPEHAIAYLQANFGYTEEQARKKVTKDFAQPG